MWLFYQIQTLLIVNHSYFVPSIQHKPSLVIKKVFTVQGKEKFEDSTEQRDFNAEGSNTNYCKELSDEGHFHFQTKSLFKKVQEAKELIYSWQWKEWWWHHKSTK